MRVRDVIWPGPSPMKPAIQTEDLVRTSRKVSSSPKKSRSCTSMRKLGRCSLATCVTTKRLRKLKAKMAGNTTGQ